MPPSDTPKMPAGNQAVFLIAQTLTIFAVICFMTIFTDRASAGAALFMLAALYLGLEIAFTAAAGHKTSVVACAGEYSCPELRINMCKTENKYAYRHEKVAHHTRRDYAAPFFMRRNYFHCNIYGTSGHIRLYYIPPVCCGSHDMGSPVQAAYAERVGVCPAGAGGGVFPDITVPVRISSPMSFSDSI